MQPTTTQIAKMRTASPANHVVAAHRFHRRTLTRGTGRSVGPDPVVGGRFFGRHAAWIEAGRGAAVDVFAVPAAEADTAEGVGACGRGADAEAVGGGAWTATGC